MNKLQSNPIHINGSDGREPSTFESIFFRGGTALTIQVPDYQRAYSWEEKQVELFIADLAKYHDPGRGYYFGHFIVENDGKGVWEMVDGQQRITTFVLFLMVCRVHSPSGTHDWAYSMIQRFSTASYDDKALATIGANLEAFLDAHGHFDSRKPPSDEQFVAGLSLSGVFTRSQRRMVLALLRFHHAFQSGKLERDKIAAYLAVVLKAHCSYHLAQDKSVAVNIFEMHNTRGIPLTTLEVIKAKLMKFVYDHGGREGASHVAHIQAEFGDIYSMEEQMATSSFRGEITMEQLLRLHLRTVDDGTKKGADDFRSPAPNANSETLVAYVDSRLHGNTPGTARGKGVQYALNLATELKNSVRILSQSLPEWDKEDSLVGDVLILERDLSCQFFLIVCRCLERSQGRCDGRIGNRTLSLWERLLFTQDFHGGYYNLKGARDDYPALFASCGEDEAGISETLTRYLADGFRPDRTKGLQTIVATYLNTHQASILNTAFHWWKYKMIYAIYKYEISEGANIREVMRGTISVEHILPQEWDWNWTQYSDEAGTGSSGSGEREAFQKEIDGCINGIGNLLLVTPGMNSSVGNNHPAEKRYEGRCVGGSYHEHDLNRGKWRRSEDWPHLIRERGERILKHMLSNLVSAS